MQRQKGIFSIAEGQYETLKHKMLSWANRFSILVFLDSNNYTIKHKRYECLLGAGSTADCFELDAVQAWHNANKDWLFGHICYDYKNASEPKLASRHPIKKGWGSVPLQFFCPQVVFYVDAEKTNLMIETLHIDPVTIFEEINSAEIPLAQPIPHLQFQKKIDKGSYLATINRLRTHIADGDCYEINYCNEGYCDNVEIDTLSVFNALNKLSPAPFAAYYRNQHLHLICASPERYLYKEGGTVLSQPIKGTARRDADPIKDGEIKKTLQHSIKDRAENVMITDLVRNDLARSCETGSIEVDELFGIYSFPQVHQMISTVSGKLRPQVPFTDAIRYSFPMGSMTGGAQDKSNGANR